MYRLVCRGPWTEGPWTFPSTYTITIELYDVVYGGGWFTDIFTKVQIYIGGVLHEIQGHTFPAYRESGPYFNQLEGSAP